MREIIGTPSWSITGLVVSVGAKAQRCNYIFEEGHVYSNIYKIAVEATPSIPNTHTYKSTFTEAQHNLNRQPEPWVSDVCASISADAVFVSTNSPAFQEPESSPELKWQKRSSQIQKHKEQRRCRGKAFQRCCLINRGDRSRLALLSWLTCVVASLLETITCNLSSLKSERERKMRVR